MPQEFFVSPWSWLLWFIAALVTLTIHEFAHAITAYALGDPTPKEEGRLTLFPFPHVDPVGFVLILLFGIGWAKPVRFEPSNLRSPAFGTLLVFLAGPIANAILLLATIFAGKFLLSVSGGTLSLHTDIFLRSLMLLNALLLVINLIPLPPFDGTTILLHALAALRLDRIREFFVSYGRYVSLIIIFLDSFFGTRFLGTAVSFLVAWGERLIQ